MPQATQATTFFEKSFKNDEKLVLGKIRHNKLGEDLSNINGKANTGVYLRVIDVTGDGKTAASGSPFTANMVAKSTVTSGNVTFEVLEKKTASDLVNELLEEGGFDITSDINTIEEDTLNKTRIKQIKYRATKDDGQAQPHVGTEQTAKIFEKYDTSLGDIVIDARWDDKTRPKRQNGTLVTLNDAMLQTMLKLSTTFGLLDGSPTTPASSNNFTISPGVSYPISYAGETGQSFSGLVNLTENVRWGDTEGVFHALLTFTKDPTQFDAQNFAGIVGIHYKDGKFHAWPTVEKVSNKIDNFNPTFYSPFSRADLLILASLITVQ